MHSQKSPSKKPSIPIDAWKILEDILAPERPSPDKPEWKMIAEQERMRILEVLKHRVNVYGIAYDT